MEVSESFWDKQLEIDAKEEATNPENIAYKILKADVNKRQILKKMDEFVIIPESLIEDSMTYLVWDMLGLKKERVSKVKSNVSGELTDDGYCHEYEWEETLSEMYYGVGGVVEGGIDINEYIDTIIKMVKEEY